MRTQSQKLTRLAVAAVLVAAMPAGGDEPPQLLEIHERLTQALCAGEDGEPRPCKFHLWSHGGFLGVELTSLTPELRAHFGAPEDAGVMIARVVEGSPAEKAGLAVGDILVRIDDEDVASSGEAARLVRSKEAGETVVLHYFRDGGLETATAEVGEHQRRALDLAKVLTLKGGELDTEHLEEAARQLSERLQREDWRRHLRGRHPVDVKELEQRMEELQERLRELEKRLARELGDGDGGDG